MKQNQSVNRLRKSLLAGIASVSLVAVGCGGGGNGTVTPQTTPLLSIFKDGTATVEVYDVTGGTGTSGTMVATGTLSAGALSVVPQNAVTNAANTWYFVRAQSGQGRVGVFMTGTELVNGGPTAHLNFSPSRVAATYQLMDFNKSTNDFNPAGAVLGVPSLTSADKVILTTATSSAFTGNAVLGGYSFAIDQVANGTNRYVATTSTTQVPFDAVVEGIVQGQSIAYVGVTEDPTGAIANGSASIGTVSDVRFATANLTGTSGAFADAARMRAARLAISSLYRILANRAAAPASATGINNLIEATLSIPNTADATKVADIANVVADSVELVANAGSTAATDLLTTVLGSVSNIPTTLVNNQANIVTAVENTLPAVVDSVVNNTVSASNSAQFLGSLAGTLMANNRAATNSAVAKVVSLANDNFLPDNAAAQRLVGAILQASARVVTAQANFFQAISNVATSRGTNLGTLISDSVATIARTGGSNVADLYTSTVTALQSSTVTQVVANASTVINSLVDAALANSAVAASGLQAVLDAAGQGATPKLQVAIAGDSTINLKQQATAQTVTFTNQSKAANLTPSPSYVWSVTPTTAPVASFTSTTAAGSFSVTFAANATGTATVYLNGSGSGLSEQTSVTVNIAKTIPVDAEISGPSVVTSGVAFVVTYSIYDAEATESEVVTISGATSQTWTTAELKSGAKKTATVTLHTLGNNPLGNQSVYVTYKNAVVTSLGVNVRDYVYALSLTQIGTGSEVTITDTTAILSIVSTLIDADPVAALSTYALAIVPVNGTCQEQGALAYVTGTSGVSASTLSTTLTVSTTVTAGNSYRYCATAMRNGKTTQNIDKVFSVRQADAVVINSVLFNGASVALGGSVTMTATNTSLVSPLLSVNVTGTATKATIGFGQTSVDLTTGSANLTATLTDLAPAAAGIIAAEVTVISNTGRTTKFPFAFTVTRMDVVTVTGFKLNTVPLGMGSVSNMTLPLSTNAATVNNNNVSLGVTFDAASADSTGITSSLTIKLSDVDASTGVAATNGATAELTVSGIRLVNTGGTWTVVAINGTNFQLSASAVGRGGTPSGSGMSTENAATLSNYFSGTATNLNINLAALRDRLGTLSNLSGLNQITSLTGQNIKVEVSFSYGSSQEMRAAGFKFDKAVVNGVTVQ